MIRIKDNLRPLYYKMVHGHVISACNRTKKDYKKFKNIHQKNRCFIVANGASLLIRDLEVLHEKQEITFGMNRIYMLFDKTRWRPTYFITQDPTIIRKNYNDICKHITKSTIFEKPPGELWFDIPNAIYFDIDYSKSWKGIFPGFSNGDNNVLYDGKTVTYSAIQLAVYMGFSDIYLIGCDYNYSDNNQITINSYPDSRMYDPKKIGRIPDVEYQFMAYSAAKKYADEQGIRIFNATRGGKLEIFKRVNFDNVFVS